jgi:hypothetical protein
MCSVTFLAEKLYKAPMSTLSLFYSNQAAFTHSILYSRCLFKFILYYDFCSHKVAFLCVILNIDFIFLCVFKLFLMGRYHRRYLYIVIFRSIKAAFSRAISYSKCAFWYIFNFQFYF